MVYIYGAFSSFSGWGNDALGLKCWGWFLSYSFKLNAMSLSTQEKILLIGWFCASAIAHGHSVQLAVVSWEINWKLAFQILLLRDRDLKL